MFALFRSTLAKPAARLAFLAFLATPAIAAPDLAQMEAPMLAEKVAAGELKPEDIDEQAIAANLYQPNMPDPDLVIRTAGEMRLSNFLLWQVSYAELYVTDTLWPDFREEHLHAALEDFARRERRFGGLVDRAQSQSAAG